MIDHDIVPLLQCPTSGSVLELDDDPERCRSLSGRLAAGELMLRSGERPAGRVDAVLRADGGIAYPVLDGVACLLPETALAEVVHGQAPAPSESAAQREIQRRQMQKYSEVYERWTGGERGITRALQRGLHERYSALFAGATVLDVGNGGTPPEQQLGAELAATVQRFIALDRSPDMLRRSGLFGELLLGDAFALPFRSGSVDIVMVNNTIHHFGLRRDEDPAAKLGAFLDEALRVSRRAVVGVELLVPAAAQAMERLLLKAVGFAPTFVYSAPFYRKAFVDGGYRVADFGVRKLRQLTSPWRFIPPVLDFTWLRVPTFAVPYSFLFFALEIPTEDRQPLCVP